MRRPAPWPSSGDEAKRNLYRSIVDNLEPFGIPKTHVKILLRELARENWGIRGGQAGCDVELGFKVEVQRAARPGRSPPPPRGLAPHLTPENHREVLESARGKKKLEVEEIVARLQPRPDARASVRRLPAPPLAPPAAEAPVPTTAAPAEAPAPIGSPSLPPPGPPSRSLPLPGRAVPPQPLSPGRYKLQLTIGEGTLEKLRRAKDLLRHAIPSGDEAQVLDRALTALLADLAKKKHAAAERPRASRGTAPGSRHIPAAVQRAVWRRDAGRCAFVGTGDRRCTERAFLEYHHVHPYAAGGPATLANIHLRCFRHNRHEARLYFGEVHENGAPYDARSRVMLEATRSGTSRRARSSGRSRPPRDSVGHGRRS